MEETQISTVTIPENLHRQIACVTDINEAKDLASRSAALQVYAKASNQSLDVFNEVAELKLRAERKAGQILAEMQKKSNQHGDTNAEIQSLEEMGISRMQSSRWQCLARIEESAFVRYCEDQRASGKEITQAGVIRLKHRLEDQPREKMHLPCPACGLRQNRCIDTGEVAARVLPRRRKCLNCNYVFRTWEMVIPDDGTNLPNIPIVISKDAK